MGKVVVLGLDGATFALLDPLLQAGRLTHLARLARNGVRGSLRSTTHPLTPAAWTSAVTGLNPGKHGIFDFRRRRAGSYTLELVNARQRHGQALWSILSERGRRVGVFNVPMSYPPEPVNGFMVSGMDAPGRESNFVFPAALRSSLLAAVPDYHIDLDESTTDTGALLQRIEALADVEQRALDVLIEKHPDPDFLMAVLVATDRLYHTFWRDLDPSQTDTGGRQAGDVRAFHARLLRRMDETLGRLWAWAGDDATIMVMSDHGFGPLVKDVYMNRFLMDAGFLHFRSRQDNAPFAEMVDWQRTRAYSFGFFGNIFLNLRGREPLGCVEQGRQAEDVKRELIGALHELRDPDDGAPLVDAIFRPEELYSGPHVTDAPDLLVIMRNYAYMTRDGYEGVRSAVVGPPMSLNPQRLPHSGNHRLDGVFLMAGPGIRSGVEISGATLLDIAPTVLYTQGLPVPGIMDGHVLRQAFLDEVIEQRPPRRLLSAPPPVESAGQRQLSALTQRLGEFESRVRELEANEVAAAGYSQHLAATIAAKNRHIEQLEATLAERTGELAAYRRSVFHRAYQRWQRLRSHITRGRSQGR